MDSEPIKAIWKWKDEENWVAFDIEICQKIEALYRIKRLIRLKIKDDYYEFDFVTYKQTHIKSKKVNSIKRSVSNYAFWNYIDGDQFNRFEPTIESQLESLHHSDTDTKQISGIIISINGEEKLLTANVDKMELIDDSTQDTFIIIRNLVTPQSAQSQNPTNTVNSTHRNNCPSENHRSSEKIISNCTYARTAGRSHTVRFWTSFLNIFRTQKSEECSFPISSFIRKRMNLSFIATNCIISEGALEYKGVGDIIEQFNKGKIFEKVTPRDEMCAICLATMHDDVIKLSECPHYFHYGCFTLYIQQSQKAGIVCPICCKLLHKGNGPSPKGTMLWTISSSPLISVSGSRNAGLIIILYVIPSGLQTQRHLNPGKSFVGSIRIAYLPNDEEGRLIFTLLKRAFMEGHTFTVGNSVTTGRKNVVTWNGIHHKTHYEGGFRQYGYPDDTYFDRVLAELKEKGIEPTEDDLENVNINRN